MSGDQILMSSAQVRAARGLLNWTQSELASRCGLTKATIANIENEKHHLTSNSAKKLFSAFTEAKVEFLLDGGLRNKIDLIKTLEGEKGFCNLLDDIYGSVKDNGGCIKASGVDESLIEEKVNQDYINMHINRMSKVKDLKFDVLISDKDSNPSARSYVKYRTLPAEYFFPLQIYMYDKKVAFVIFDPLRVIIIENFHIFLVHSNQFDMMWEKVSSAVKK
ncbi:MAG: transcriptional regulator with XRE-family HTH domain [Candidatus Midichloriaceae bacterium]|jgi:transcriptional regulator with XRE-family HTH domain